MSAVSAADATADEREEEEDRRSVWWMAAHAECDARRAPLRPLREAHALGAGHRAAAFALAVGPTIVRVEVAATPGIGLDSAVAQLDDTRGRGSLCFRKLAFLNLKSTFDIKDV